jgi:hypothetical protein
MIGNPSKYINFFALSGHFNIFYYQLAWSVEHGAWGKRQWAIDSRQEQRQLATSNKRQETSKKKPACSRQTALLMVSQVCKGRLLT